MPIDSFVAFVVAAVVPLVAGARGITFLVDRTRDAVPFGDAPGLKILWGLEALALSLLLCLGFSVNPIGKLLATLPKSGNLNETVGEVLSAVAFAGLASSWHDRDKAKNPPAA